MKAADISDADVLALVEECNEARCDYPMTAGYHGGRPGYGFKTGPTTGHWANRWDLAEKLGVPDKVLLAKMRKLIKQGKVNGCACGCRGDFTL